MNCFYFLASSNNGVINIPVKYSCFHFPWLFPRNEIAETWGIPVWHFEELSNFSPTSHFTFLAAVYEAWYLPSSLPSLCLHDFNCSEYIWFINDFFHLWQWNCVSSFPVSFYTFCFWCHSQETHSKQCSFSAAFFEHFIFSSYIEAYDLLEVSMCAAREGSNLFQPVRRPFVENEMCMDFRACSEIFPSAELCWSVCPYINPQSPSHYSAVIVSTDIGIFVGFGLFVFFKIVLPIF